MSFLRENEHVQINPALQRACACVKRTEMSQPIVCVPYQDQLLQIRDKALRQYRPRSLETEARLRLYIVVRTVLHRCTDLFG